MSDVSVVLFYSLDVLLRLMRSYFPYRLIWGTDKANFSMTIQRCEKSATARMGKRMWSDCDFLRGLMGTHVGSNDYPLKFLPFQ